MIRIMSGKATRTKRFGMTAAVSLGLVLLASCSNKSEGLGVYPKAMGAADEGSAIQTLKTIATAEGQFRVTRGSYGDFEALTQGGYLDQRFAGPAPNLRGYRFTLTASETEFSVNADPQTTETQPTTGSRHFYLDGSDNAVHANSTRAASKTDPVVGT